MRYSFHHQNRLVKAVGKMLYYLPAPANLSIHWNFGSLLGVCLFSQIITGLMLASHYTPELGQAFDSVNHIMSDVSGGWLTRVLHMNGASFFFICVFIHMGRGIYYSSFSMVKVWLSGYIMFFLLMMIAFTGYILPWGQMSYWGVTVITNLFGAIPYLGPSLVEWIWGGFCISDATLKRFFVLHFVSPFLLAVLAGVHIMLLHDSGSGNPLGVSSDVSSVPFHSYYTWKDLLGVGMAVVLGGVVCLFSPDLFTESANSIKADPMSTPLHIQPEWYFLFAYTILRSIPHKEWGAFALVMSLFTLVMLPMFSCCIQRGAKFNPLSQTLFFIFVFDFLLLSYIGTCPVEYPYSVVGLSSTVFFFFFFVAYPYSGYWWDLVVFSKLNSSLVLAPIFSRDQSSPSSLEKASEVFVKVLKKVGKSKTSKSVKKLKWDYNIVDKMVCYPVMTIYNEEDRSLMVCSKSSSLIVVPKLMHKLQVKQWEDCPMEVTPLIRNEHCHSEGKHVAQLWSHSESGHYYEEIGRVEWSEEEVKLYKNRIVDLSDTKVDLWKPRYDPNRKVLVTVREWEPCRLIQYVEFYAPLSLRSEMPAIPMKFFPTNMVCRNVNLPEESLLSDLPLFDYLEYKSSVRGQRVGRWGNVDSSYCKSVHKGMLYRDSKYWKYLERTPVDGLKNQNLSVSKVTKYVYDVDLKQYLPYMTCFMVSGPMNGSFCVCGGPFPPFLFEKELSSKWPNLLVWSTSYSPSPHFTVATHYKYKDDEIIVFNG